MCGSGDFMPNRQIRWWKLHSQAFLHDLSFRQMPPGPWSVPYLGVLCRVNQDAPQLTFTEWSKRYGPIMSFTFYGMFYASVMDQYGYLRFSFSIGNIFYLFRNPPESSRGFPMASIWVSLRDRICSYSRFVYANGCLGKTSTTNTPKVCGLDAPT